MKAFLLVLVVGLMWATFCYFVPAENWFAMVGGIALGSIAMCFGIDRWGM